MRSPAQMTTIQIELTSACVLRCSNCTRFCGTHKVPFFMEASDFCKAVDSLVEYAKQPHTVVGFMGGEPLLHPQFAEFCEYASSRIPREHLGLWSTFPDSPKYKAYGPLICKTFGSVYLNDHSRDDILHAPVLMAAEDHYRKPCPRCAGNAAFTEDSGEPCATCGGKGTVADVKAILDATENCWIQDYWSASVNPKGAWFCEVAAALSIVFDGPEGWKVEPGWWKRKPEDFAEQRKWACQKCGAALPLTRIRNSQDPRDDVSESNLERLEAVKSRKVARGEYALREKFEFDQRLIDNTYPDQTYKGPDYRFRIAERYGIGLRLNPSLGWEPYLLEEERRRLQAPPAVSYSLTYSAAAAEGHTVSAAHVALNNSTLLFHSSANKPIQTKS